jgi:hypothetical protein
VVPPAAATPAAATPAAATDDAVQPKSADRGKAYVSHGVVLVSEQESALPASKVAGLQKRLAKTCSIPAGRIKVEAKPGNMLDIYLTVASQADYHRLIQRISQVPELRPYQVHIHMQKAN